MSQSQSQSLQDAPAIYHIATAADWRHALAEGRYHGSVLCRADGFIHMSTRAQIPGTLRRFFDARGDLVLIAADSADLGAELRWEEVPGVGTFPHYYGALDVARVRMLGPITLDAEGRHLLPDQEIAT